MVDKHELGYTLLSDATMGAAYAYGIAYKVDKATVDRYKGYGIDLEAASGQSHLELPVPAVFVYDASGAMTFQYVNPDHKTRVPANVLLAAVRAAAETP